MQFKKGIYLFSLIGLILGIVFDQMIRYEVKTAFYYSLIAFFGLLYGLTYNEKNLIRLFGTSFVVALILSLPLLPINHFLGETPTHMLTFLLAFPIWVYVGHSFHFAYHQDSTWKVHYESLFAAVWNTLPLLFIACLFTSLANALVYFGAAVFKTVGSNFLWDLYSNNFHFRIILTSTLFFIGLGIGQQNFKVIYNIRFLLLRMMYYLFPALALISALYVILYLAQALIFYFTPPTIFGSVTSGAPFYPSTLFEPIDPLAVMIPLSILGVVFFNAYFQDGGVDPGAPKWLRVFLRFYRVILLLLILIMTFKLIQSHVLDSNGCIYLLAAIFLGITYAMTSWMSENKELYWIRRGNVGTALFFFMTLFLFNIPYLPIEFTLNLKNTKDVVIIPLNNPPPVEFNTRTEHTKTDLTKIDTMLKKQGFYWENGPTKSSFISNSQGSNKIYICRSFYKQGYQIGEFINEKCWISYAGKAFTVSKFQVLSGGQLDKIKWVTIDYPVVVDAQAEGPYGMLGFEYLYPDQSMSLSKRNLYACRTLYKQKEVVGKLVGNTCNISVGDQEKALNHYEVMLFK